MTAKDWLTFFASPTGRITRFDYNIKFFVVTFIIGLITFAIDYAYLGQAIFEKGAHTYATWVMQVLFVWPFFATTTKRLHDLNYRGWWILPAYLGPILIGSGLMGYFMAKGQIIAVSAVGFLIFAAILTFIIILSCARGTKGPNRFGPDPVEHSVTEGLSL